MSDPFVAEIRIFAGNFAPKGWAFCNGQLMPLSQNTALFSLLGTTYGGDGKSTFALPDLQGRSPMHWGQGPGLTDRVLGEEGGAESVTLLTSELPAHSHVAHCNPDPEEVTGNPTNAFWSSQAPGSTPAYVTSGPSTIMHPLALQQAGASMPHNNRQPFLTVNFIIALQGIYPSRS